jgi:nucleoside-diphosphate-sugar epimerase
MPYPSSKAAAEGVLRRMAAERQLDLRVLRFAFVYGLEDPHLAEAMQWAREWPAHKRLHLVHHADASRALSLALRAAGASGGTYNVADDAPVTTAELHALNHERMPDEPATRPLEDPWEGVVDTTRITEELGFRPVYPTVYAAREAGAL